MRNDEQGLGKELANSKEWHGNRRRASQLFVTGRDETGKPLIRAHPFSAGEKNAFFVNDRQGEGFINLSALSGLDHSGDSRAFVLFDYDKDGDQDLALINANGPSLQLFQTSVPTPGNFLVVQLQGAGAPRSNRDAIGAIVQLNLKGGRKLTKTLNAGEGYGSQNSKTLIFGLGDSKEIAGLKVTWPSGQVFEYSAIIRKNQLLNILEMTETSRLEFQRYGG